MNSNRIATAINSPVSILRIAALTFIPITRLTDINSAFFTTRHTVVLLTIISIDTVNYTVITISKTMGIAVGGSPPSTSF
jgi:hypothetical protein